MGSYLLSKVGFWVELRCAHVLAHMQVDGDPVLGRWAHHCS